jgi:rhomboid protease GluP
VFQRRTTGSVVCPSCGSLVGVRDEKCYTCGRTNPGLWGFGPLLRQLGNDFSFVPIVIGGSAALYLLTLLISGRELQVGGGGLAILSPSVESLFLFGASGSLPVFRYGRWWTVLSATWLHAGVLHILFNMLAFRQIGPTASDILGPARTVIIYTVAGVAGFLLSSVAGVVFPGVPFLSGAPFTVGASASIFGLVGALVHYGRVSGSHLIRGHFTQYAILMFVMGLMLPGIDNYAHAGGFAGGYLTSAILNPLKRERGDHVIGAIACLTATLLAVVFSVMSGWNLI